MKEYGIIRAPKLPDDWAEVPRLAIDCLLWSRPVSVTAAAQICYDEQALFVRLSAAEEHIRAEHDSLTGMPCEDSCLEFFFCPIPGDERYFNIEFNPNCCMYLGLGSGVQSLVRLLPERPCFLPQAERTDSGWQITYQVPVAFIRQFFPDFAAISGATIRANCFKCGDLTVQEHYLSWNPVTSETPCFHRPCDFGLMRFV